MRFAINGARGRMGRMISTVIAESGEHQVVALVEAAGHPDVGEPVRIGNDTVTVIDDPGAIPSGVDAGLDFSAPGSGAGFAAAMAERGAALVVGTTALAPADIEFLRGISNRIPVLVASNTSVGVFCLTELTLAARRLLGDSYDVEIVEMHHRHKKDAPSGTALSIAGALSATGLTPRTDRTGPRVDGEVGVTAARGGEVVGTHTVYFLGRDDQIEICHRANSRMALAEGAVRLGGSLKGRAPGWYSVADLLRS